MRLMPILTALIVSTVLYFLVLERDTLLAIAQVNATSETTEEVDTTLERVSVVVETSNARVVDSAVILRGRTEAARQVTVAAETSGVVISDPIRKGAMIQQGEILCSIDPGTRQAALAEANARLTEARGAVPAAQAAMAEATARVREAEINLNAAERLSEEGYASETTLVSAQAALEAARAGVQAATSQMASAEAGIQSAEAAVAAATREIERLEIAAPFSGILESDTAELGTLMQPGSACATIIQLNPIKLVGFVPETDVGKVSIGANAGARLASGTEVRGVVTFISRSADDTTRTFRVEVEVPNDDQSIRDGQTAEILIASEGRFAHLLDASSLTLNDDGDIGIRAVDAENVTRFMPVSVLRDTVDGIWVTGLPETVNVIVVGQEYVRDGVPVEPTFREAKG